jgi:CMP-N-acetylneuraminic acid synthetase
MIKEKTNCLAIIPARGGSKGIPRKNISALNEKLSIYYAIEEALKSKYLFGLNAYNWRYKNGYKY